MRSVFFIVGPHIAQDKSVGEIDMRRVAPTIAGILHIRLAGAELDALALN
jgi:hypothetical protein